MVTTILIRHGESNVSVRGVVNGDPRAAVALTPEGEAQARRVGRELAGEPIDLCVVSEFPRTRQTAEIALEGRPVRIEVWPELNDPRYGEFEGGSLDRYREWAWAHGSIDEAPGGGESRQAIVARYAVGFRRLVERPERTVLAVAHSLPVAYALAAARGEDPAPRVDLVEYAEPHRLTEDELRAAVERLEAWCAEPSW
jgi:2,3-bisphosphoglycerate-dependent phosphoglycerate mutase